jgi:hypothetical protein
MLDSATGRWRSRGNALDDNDGNGHAGSLITGIRPFVTDIRNILLLRPVSNINEDETFLKSLAYALRRALQIEYQVEEREILLELIGAARPLAIGATTTAPHVFSPQPIHATCFWLTVGESYRRFLRISSHAVTLRSPFLSIQRMSQ